MSHTDEFGPTVTNSSLKSYDFEQVAVHEILHGLGFSSGWGKWLNDATFYPSFLEYDQFGQFKGFGPSWIYDKYMSDAVNGIWIRDYDRAIRQDVNKSLNIDPKKWKENFLNTTGYKIAKALGEEVSTIYNE